MTITGFESSALSSVIDLFNQLPEYIHCKDRDLRYVLMNNFTATRVGYTSSDMSFEGVTDRDLPCKAAEIADTFRKEDELVLQSGQTVSMINYCCYKDNDWRLIWGRKSPLKNTEGEIIGVYGRGVDVSDCGLMRTAFLVFVNDEKRFGSKRDALNQTSYILKDKFDDYGLSVRESECLFHLIRGKTAKEIAAIYKISFRTVEKHLERLKYKLNCFHRSEIVDKAISEGLGTVMPKSLFTNTQI
ncbi:MAG: helix-turn-helix transcriptional regulator [Pseudomonadota bacterium]|nr:helix-turn-helix transcriptional regulator [Pseudomonadota bacterium]